MHPPIIFINITKTMKITGIILYICMGLAICSLSCKKKYTFKFQNTNLDFETRVDDLVSRMTLEEKVSQMVNDARAIPRLGIPKYNWWNECLHGVARAGEATVFPQSIGLAATWDTALIYKVGNATSDEARAKHHNYKRHGEVQIFQGLTFWSPNINIFRDPRWGRGMETYGEDPYLTGRLGVQFIKGLQGNNPKYWKLVATSKHYIVHSGPESERHKFDALVGNRDFLETYLPAFRMTVEEANVHSVMCAYNRTNEEVCCGSSHLLTELLRDTMGFKGYIVSDCDAISDFFSGHKVVNSKPEAAVKAVRAGDDLNCGETYQGLLEAVKKGLISEAEIDVSLKRLMYARFKLGMFDPDEMVPFARIPISVVGSEEHVKLAEETAKASIVLLKNESNLLPLKKSIKTLAVIGPNANDIDVIYGNYNGISRYPVTPLEGIKSKLPKTEVLFSRGCDIAENMPSLEVIPGEMLFTTADMKQHGIKGEYFTNRNFKGQPKIKRTDDKIEFNWWDGTPGDGFEDNNFSVHWSGYIKAPKTGDYYIGAEGGHKYRMEFNGEQIINYFTNDNPSKEYKKVQLVAGKCYPVQIFFTDTMRMASMNLLWQVPEPDLTGKAVAIASKSDVIVMFMGLSPRLEGEEMNVDVKGFKGGDRTSLDIPEVQTKLIKKIYATGKPVVLVLLNGSAVSVNWENANIQAILEAWYPGQAAGTAIADVLFGDYNPSGRLPVTFYKNIEDLPYFTDYNMEGKTYRYFRKTPLYEFGFGLSYTTFSYSNLHVPEKLSIGTGVKASVEVTNTGKADGNEIVQLYISNKTASVPVPVRTLKGFTKVFLKAGESKIVTMNLKPDDFSIIDNNGKRIISPGLFSISIGGCQPGKEALLFKKAVTAELAIK
jgi:beta-glucosidase